MFPSLVSGAARSWIAAALLATLVAVPFPSAAADADAASAEPAEEAQPQAALARIAICEEVQERTPIGEAERFTNDIGRLWCFTKIVGADNPTTIFHRWYVGDKLVQEIPITVKGSSWRCWSNKGIRSAWTGDCRVEILTESGDVLGSKEFTLTGPSEDESDSSDS